MQSDHFALKIFLTNCNFVTKCKTVTSQFVDIFLGLQFYQSANLSKGFWANCQVTVEITIVFLQCFKIKYPRNTLGIMVDAIIFSIFFKLICQGTKPGTILQVCNKVRNPENNIKFYSPDLPRSNTLHGKSDRSSKV